MADQFKTFDNDPIVGGVNTKCWSFTKREIAIAVVAVLALVLCFVFIALYASKASGDDSNSLTASAIIEKQYCTSKECLETVANALKLMNSSVDPCDNFYEYACGNYKTYSPRTHSGSNSILGNMRIKNREKLIDILEKPPTRITKWSYEQKLSTFYTSCLDDFGREKAMGRPFLEQVVPKLGGWQLLGTWDEDKWDLNTVLKKVQSDFWVQALYFTMIPIPMMRNEMIFLYPPVKESWTRFSDFPDIQQNNIRNQYAKFIKRVGYLFMRDAKLINVTKEERHTRLDQFVKDVLTVQDKLVEALESASIKLVKQENLVTINDLNQESGETIDWKDQLAYMYRPADVNGGTKISLAHETYFKKMAEAVKSFPDAHRKRLLHNYLIWRCAEKYAKDLSFEYLIAYDDFHNQILNESHLDGLEKYCRSTCFLMLKDATGALYVQQHLDGLSKNKVEDITTHLKKAVQLELDHNPWMDEETRKYAKDKLDKVSYKIGYPDWMADHEKVDEMYADLKVNRTDFFGNLLSASQFLRLREVKSFQQLLKREDWIHDISGVSVSHERYWNQIIVTAGILQDPMYNRDAPHFKTFGSLGALIGRYMYQCVGQNGQHFDKTGKFLEKTSWWSPQSIKAYREIDTCVKNVYSAELATKDFYQSFQRDTSELIYNMVVIATTSGIRLALKGYQDWVKALGIKEKTLAGLGLSTDQMIFLSFAQSRCDYSTDREKFIEVMQDGLLEDIEVNMALGQLQEFSDAFQCKPNSKMNHKKKCTYF